ncbi:MAG: hypothetical protein GC185_02925 [Alphaproteobacteria bacterium]|nr:hypothetical protein [Alphaproteobacteria bacterium]
MKKFFKSDEKVSEEISNSPGVNIDGFESLISLPEPTRQDRRFARKMKSADSETVARELGGAIARGENWRVWYLLNRPRKLERDGLRGIFTGKLKSTGFEGGERVERALASAAAFENPTAAYLLLKFAENNPPPGAPFEIHGPAISPQDDNRQRLENLTLKALQGAAIERGEKTFALLAHNFARLAGAHPAGSVHVMAHESNMKQVALTAAAADKHVHLDALHAEKLLTPPQFVEAFMGSFLNDGLFMHEDDAPASKLRKPFLSWLMNKGFVDETFADQAATVEVRVADAKKFNEEARKKGWKESTRTIETADGQTHEPGAEQVEISRTDSRTGKVLTYVFNYTAQAAFLIKGALQNRVPLEKLPEQDLVEEGRAFLESCRPETPELTWEKGKPFRLQLKPSP